MSELEKEGLFELIPGWWKLQDHSIKYILWGMILMSDRREPYYDELLFLHEICEIKGGLWDILQV